MLGVEGLVVGLGGVVDVNHDGGNLELGSGVEQGEVLGEVVAFLAGLNLVIVNGILELLAAVVREDLLGNVDVELIGAAEGEGEALDGHDVAAVIDDGIDLLAVLGGDDLIVLAGLENVALGVLDSCRDLLQEIGAVVGGVDRRRRRRGSCRR